MKHLSYFNLLGVGVGGVKVNFIILEFVQADLFILLWIDSYTENLCDAYIFSFSAAGGIFMTSTSIRPQHNLWKHLPLKELMIANERTTSTKFKWNGCTINC